MGLSDKDVGILNSMNPSAQAVGLGGLIDDASGVKEGEEYFVDGNVLFTGAGDSWGTAFKTLAEAITASNANISSSLNRAWAARNKIYVRADTLEEDLVLFPEKCDIIGVGSYDANKCAGLKGKHVPAGGKMGCRWINMRFLEDSGSEGIFFTIGSTSGGGMEFIDCIFDSRGLTMTSAISITAMSFIKITNCKFIGPITAWTNGAILVGAGAADGLEICGNYITGAQGIVLNSSMTSAAEFVRIEDNTIHAATMCIDDNSDKALIIGNMCMSAAADGGATAPGCMDGNIKLASGNYLAGDDSNGPWPNLDEHS